MGESLILSWLRHIKKCQSVQLNWKPSSNHWKLSNQENIEKMMIAVNEYFETKHSFNIFKNNKSYLQLLLQGEIDAFGLQIENSIVTNMYGVDVAFHEGGLNYGDKKTTVERVIKKLVRTAMLFNGYFNMNEGNIIFSSPKINPSVYGPMMLHLGELRELFNTIGFDYEFQVIANNDFKCEILDPVISISSSVADTSELFLRSIQMYQMFGDTAKNGSNIDNKIVSATEKEQAGEPKIGSFVQSTFNDLIRQGKLSTEKLAHLCDARYCKNTFLLPYPMLKKIEGNKSIHEQRNINGRPRYYANVLTIEGASYLLCNHWVEKSRQPYEVWLSNIQKL